MLSLVPVVFFLSLGVAIPISPEAANAGAASVPASEQGKPASEGVTTFDGVALSGIAAAPTAEEATAGAISQAGWTCTTDSYEAADPCTNAFDGDNTTLWQSEYSPDEIALPHYIIINMGASYTLGSIVITPRTDDSANGNIGEHIISVSTDGTDFSTIAFGTYIDDQSLKTTTFTPVTAQYFRIDGLTEAGDRGPYTTIAEVNAVTAAQDLPPSPVGNGAWVYTVDFPLVPVSMANDWATGNLHAWSSYNPSTFGGSDGTQTVTATYMPHSQTVTGFTVTSVDHDMFCEGLNLQFDGSIIATGGNTASATSFYQSSDDDWTAGPAMNIARGYAAQVTTSAGNSFVIGASWAGGEGGKNGELYSPGADTWTLLSGCPVAPMLTGDAQGVYRADNHGWLFAWSDEYVFQAGPSVAMNWYSTTGDGGQAGAGDRGDDTDSMCGNAIMYDAVAGKILTLGGAVDYQDTDATANAHIITIGAPDTTPTVETINPMYYQRSFANSVILPDGTVFTTGGQVYADPFSDDTAQLTPELWSPATGTFTKQAPMAIARTYHSTAVLLPDATVINGGGGLCGDCATNHFDAQIFYPAYLYDGDGGLAARPTITGTSETAVAPGGTFSATTGGAVSSFALLRMTSNTHTVNTDQRRIALDISGTDGTTYTFTLPDDPGVAVPGYWYLFCVDGAGVPSVATTIQVTG